MSYGLDITDYYELKFLKSLDVDSSGTQIVYSLATYHEQEANRDNFHMKEKVNLWLFDRNTDEHRQLTYGDQDFNPSWSHDGKQIIYASKQDKKPQLFNLPLKGGAPKQLTQFENGVGAKVEWKSNNKEIFFTAIDDKQQPRSDDPYHVTRDFYRMDAMGNVDHVFQNVYLLNLETDELTQITDHTMSHSQIILSPDEDQLLSLCMFEQKGTDGIFPKLYLIDLKTNSTRKLLDYLITTAIWVTNSIIAFVGNPPDSTIGSKSDIYLLDINSNHLTNLTSDDSYGCSGGLQADMPTVEARMPKIILDGNEFLYYTQIGGTIELRAINIDTGTIKTVVGGDRANYLIAVRDDNIFFTCSNHHNPLDLFILSRNTGEEKQITTFNQDFLSTKQLPDIHHLQFQGEDGTAVEGWLLTPEGEPPYPTLLNIHGGPHSGWGNIFQFEVQYLCHAGFAVLMINHRASTGYGDEFSTSIVGDWGNHDYKDLMAGVDHVIDQGLADSNRLGCFGISGGGNLSSWIVGQNNRFKAAIPENPVTNWQSFFGVSDIGRWFATKEMGGLPWEIPDTYIKASPVTYAHQCTTPTLLIQHDNDLRCPPEQSEQFYAILKEVECTVEMLRMPGTSHGGSYIGPLKIREKQNHEIVSWFKQYVLTNV